MTTVAEVPVSAGPADTPRRRRLGLLAAGLGVVALVAAAVVALASYQPLAAGRVEVVGATSSGVISFGASEVRAVRYDDGARLGLDLTVRNRGLLPVRIVGVQPLPGAVSLLRLRDVTGRTLGPHQAAAVTVTGTFANCERISIRSSTLVTAVRLRTKVLGLFPRTMTVQLPQVLRIQSPRDEDCPKSSPFTRPIG